MKSKAAIRRKHSTQDKKQTEGQRNLRAFFVSGSREHDCEPSRLSSQDATSQGDKVVIDLVELDDKDDTVTVPLLKTASSAPPLGAKKLYSIFENSRPISPLSLPSSLPLPSSSPHASSSKHTYSIHSPSPPPTDFTSGMSSEPEFMAIRDAEPTLEAGTLIGSQNTPIDLSDSPIAIAKTHQVLHPFFSRKVAHSNQQTGDSTLEKHIPKQSTPFPSQQTQHVHDLVPLLLPPTSPVLRPRRRRRLSDETFRSVFSFDSFKQVTPDEAGEDQVIPAQQGFDDEDVERYLADIPSRHLHHPAIQRLEGFYTEASQRNGRSETWSENWKPRKAEEVLGNEEHAHYLKSWLQCLQLNLTKSRSSGDVTPSNAKRSIVRSIKELRSKKRRKTDDWERNSLDAWINDDSGEGSSTGLDEDDFILPRSSPVRRKARADELTQKESDALGPIKEMGQLTNTILISGPTGCGKTAAVYACAEQLNWQVFEVYPGVGKRTASNLTSLVGDVARNHTLTKAPRGQANLDRPQDLAIQPSVQEGSDNSIAQSIILLEEVDIMFGEDVNFWPAVIKLINKSHRPVVLTCNDPTVLPLEDLPIQAHLAFESCAEPLALSYLRCLALAEGHMLDLVDLTTRLFESRTSLRIDYPDRPIHPLPTDPRPFHIDLRKAINRMQLWCGRADHHGRTRLDSAARVGDWAIDRSLPFAIDGRVERLGHLVEMHDMYQLERFADCISEADSQLLSRMDPETELEAMHQVDSGEVHPDSESGYLIVGIAQEVSAISPVLAFYSRENEVLSTCHRRARGRLEHVGSGGRLRKDLDAEERVRYEEIYDGRGLFSRRGEHQRMVVGVLDDILPPGGHGDLLPSAVLFTEYLAWLRIMATAGDSDGSSVLLGRRRGRHALGLGREEIEVLEKTRLEV